MYNAWQTFNFFAIDIDIYFEEIASTIDRKFQLIKFIFKFKIAHPRDIHG